MKITDVYYVLNARLFFAFGGKGIHYASFKLSKTKRTYIFFKYKYFDNIVVDWQGKIDNWVDRFLCKLTIFQICALETDIRLNIRIQLYGLPK